jgi:hypothetical protein
MNLSCANACAQLEFKVLGHLMEKRRAGWLTPGYNQRRF